MADLACLDCKVPLGYPDSWGVVWCNCGLRYSDELLRSADSDTWDDLAEQRNGYRWERRDDDLIVYRDALAGS